MSCEDSVQRAIDYIEEHLEDELDLAGIAEETFLSLAQLYRVFYALTGHPVKDYIRKRRISVAADHLRNSNRKVEELAWDSGFESYHSFAKVFKKIVGLTPAAYRKADIIFSFEPIRLRESVDYLENREHSERYPDVKVIRLHPEKAHAYLHLSEQEEGMENEAFRAAYEKLAARGIDRAVKVRIFGHNVDLPSEGGTHQYGYKVLVVGAAGMTLDDAFREEPFAGGLYAVRKIAAKSPKVVQDGWNRLLADWLPKSTFEIGSPPYLEEFIAYNGKVARMNLHLPVQRKLRDEPIEIVERETASVYCWRGYGEEAQKAAKQGLIDWYESHPDSKRQAGRGTYYMSYSYGAPDSETYWWENGFLLAEPEPMPSAGLERKRMEAGRYACCATKAYGLLTGVLDKMHRWIAKSGSYRLDEERQWFAEYYAVQGTDLEQDALVKIFIPILPEESARVEQSR